MWNLRSFAAKALRVHNSPSFGIDPARCSSCERGGGTFTNLVSNRDFFQTVVSLLGEFRANGARRVVINVSGERDRQLADGFVLK